MGKKDILKAYIDSGAPIIELKKDVTKTDEYGKTQYQGKERLRTKKNTKFLTLNEAEKHYGNYGLFFNNDLFGIDIDVGKNKVGDQTWNDLIDSLADSHPDIDWEAIRNDYSVRTRSGGYHLYFRLPEGFVGKKLTGLKDIDIRYGNNGYFVIPPSAVGGKKYKLLKDNVEFPVAPAPLVEKFLAKSGNIKQTKENNKNRQEKRKESRASNEIWKYLCEIHPDCDMWNVWIKIGASIHSELPNEKGFAIWDAWSQGLDKNGLKKYDSTKYDATVMRKHWNTFSEENVRKSTIATIIDFAKITRSRRARGLDTILQEWEDPYLWVDDWVRVKGKKSFRIYNRKTRDVFNREGFNVECNDLTSFDKMTATDFIIENKRLCEHVDGLKYLPHIADDICVPKNNKTGKRFANIFKRTERENVADSVSEEGRKAYNDIVFHLRKMTGSEEKAMLMLCFPAFILQIEMHGLPKLGFALLLEGSKGIGKTWFFDLVTALVDELNCKDVDSNALTSDFNNFCQDILVARCEELKLKTRAEQEKVMKNIIKWINNRSININRKGKDEETVLNTVTWLFGTNDKNAILITDDDRRYCAICCPMESCNSSMTKKEIEEMEAYLETDDLDAYFKNLLNILDNENILPELRKILRDEIDLKKYGFLSGRAPYTDDIELLSTACKKNISLVDSINDALEVGGELFNKDYVNMSSLLNILNADGGMVSTKMVENCLIELKFVNYGRVKIGNDRPRFWVKDLPKKLSKFSKGQINKNIRESFSSAPQETPQGYKCW